MRVAVPWFSGQLLLIWGSILEPWDTILGVFGLIVGVQGPPWTPFGVLGVPCGLQGPFCELFPLSPGSVLGPILTHLFFCLCFFRGPVSTPVSESPRLRFLMFFCVFLESCGAVSVFYFYFFQASSQQ